MKYKIYKLIYNGDVVYVGRTTKTLKERKKSGYKGIGNGLELISKDCSIELIEETDDVSRERYWIGQYDNLMNVRKGEGLDRNEYYRKYNKSDKQIDYNKEYRKLNKERISERDRKYNESRKNEMKEYRQNNRDKINARRRELYKIKKETI